MSLFEKGYPCNINEFGHCLDSFLQTFTTKNDARNPTWECVELMNHFQYSRWSILKWRFLPRFVQKFWGLFWEKQTKYKTSQKCENVKLQSIVTTEEHRNYKRTDLHFKPESKKKVQSLSKWFGARIQLHPNHQMWQGYSSESTKHGKWVEIYDGGHMNEIWWKGKVRLEVEGEYQILDFDFWSDPPTKRNKKDIRIKYNKIVSKHKRKRKWEKENAVGFCVWKQKKRDHDDEKVNGFLWGEYLWQKYIVNDFCEVIIAISAHFIHKFKYIRNDFVVEIQKGNIQPSPQHTKIINHKMTN